MRGLEPAPLYSAPPRSPPPWINCTRKGRVRIAPPTTSHPLPTSWPITSKRIAPMLREAIRLLPEVVARCPLGTALGLCALGVVLWVVGGRVSRSILALVAVAGGSVVGIHLPEWFG